MRDLDQSNDLKLTQEFLAQMLGVRRTSVSLVAGTLQRAGLIKYWRGNIHLVDIEQLEQSACECYETVKGHYARVGFLRKPLDHDRLVGHLENALKVN